MSDEKRFEREEIDQIQEIAMEARDAVVERIMEAFPEKAAEAVGFALATLAASGFVNDTEAQHDMAMAVNQALSRWKHPIHWRVAPTSSDG